MTIPQPIARPQLAHWLWERGLDYRQGGALFGCSHTAVQNFCKPFTDPTRRVPKPAQMETIVARTDGAVTPASFYPPELSEAGPQVLVA